MPTRYNRKAQSRFNVPALPSGFDSPSSPNDIVVPPCGIEDADIALFNLFDKEISLQVSDNTQGMKKVPVIFAAGEKWALLKRKRALRDRNNSLILPLITIVRTTIQQLPDEDITGRGINQQTGDLVIKRRLDASDRSYQGIINRLLVQHQRGLAVGTVAGDPGQLTTSGRIGDLTEDPTVEAGGVLIPDKTNNIYEFLTIPSPQFYTGIYTVTFWSQYTEQMKQMLEQVIASFLPQGNAWRLDTTAGYWFVATVDGNTYTAEDNVEDFSTEERVLKHKFTIKVPAYILASSTPGAPVPVKRFVSAPSVSFDISTEQLDQPSAVVDPFLGADDPTLPIKDGFTKRRDNRDTQGTLLYPGEGAEEVRGNPNDPALAQLPRGVPPTQYQRVTGIDRRGNKVTKYVRIVSKNAFTGETVLAPDASLGGLTLVSEDD